MTRPALIYTWNSTPEERAEAFPCDGHLPEPDLTAFRALDVDAPATTVFRWLCQLRAAPYSYDWIDNFGRRSPRRLTPGLERLEVGQRFMTIFRLAEFEPDRSVTLYSKGRLFGRVSVTYSVSVISATRSRVVVKLLGGLPWSARPVKSLLRNAVAAGDLFMMRRQLLNLKHLAEANQRR